MVEIRGVLKVCCALSCGNQLTFSDIFLEALRVNLQPRIKRQNNFKDFAIVNYGLRALSMLESLRCACIGFKITHSN